MHPEDICSGITDYIAIEATIEDEFLYKKFIKMYGTPRFDDYELVNLLEKHKDLLIKKIEKDTQILNLKFIKIILKIYRFFKRV